MTRRNPGIRTWGDARDAARRGGGICQRSSGSHEVWVFPHGEKLTLCNKGHEDIKPGLRCHIVKCFIRWGILVMLLAFILSRMVA